MKELFTAIKLATSGLRFLVGAARAMNLATKNNDDTDLTLAASHAALAYASLHATYLDITTDGAAHEERMDGPQHASLLFWHIFCALGDAAALCSDNPADAQPREIYYLDMMNHSIGLFNLMTRQGPFRDVKEGAYLAATQLHDALIGNATPQTETTAPRL